MSTFNATYDPYASSRETTEGTVYSVTGGDWDQIATEIGESKEERVVVNMGPQHPSTHGVLRLMLELEGETVTECRCGIGYLHTGIEKNCEFRTWTQGVTFVTRMDYLAPIFNETAYCLGVERLLGITSDVPERATVIRVMMMEFNRISSHMVALGTGALELGALSPMLFAFREREKVLDIFEHISGLRMNMAYVRPGGVAQDLPQGSLTKIRETVKELRKTSKIMRNSLWEIRFGSSEPKMLDILTSPGAPRLALPVQSFEPLACHGIFERLSLIAGMRIISSMLSRQTPGIPMDAS